MATRQSQRNAFSAENQARVETAAQQAGIAAGMGQLAELAPQVLALQQAVLAGIVRSQRREAKRLAGIYGEDDPRIVRALERSEQAALLHVEVKGQAEVVGRVAQTFQREGLFHGYVHLADGTPAEGYVVKLDMRSTTDKKPLQHSTAKTDAEGYFSMDLAGAGDTTPQDPGDIKRWSDRLARLVPVEAEMDHEAPGAGEGDEAEGGGTPKPMPKPGGAPHTGAAAAPPSEPAVVSQVQVLEPSGRVVFEDPDPPTFEGASSEFRYYVVTQGSAKPPGGTTGTTGKPGRKG